VEISGRLSGSLLRGPLMNLFHLLVRMNHGLRSRFRNIWFRALGVRLRGYVWMRRISISRQWSDITIEGPASLDDGVVLLCSGTPRHKKILIRSGCYINRFTMIDASQQIEIDRDCMIGPHCYITDHDHAHQPGKLVGEQPLMEAPVRVGRNVWLGAGVIVLKGVTIGNNAVVGAGAVVTKDVPPNSKVAGVPARAVGVEE
jgi:acetyltransferase-like isoleucine patch superfamily enzyme